MGGGRSNRGRRVIFKADLDVRVVDEDGILLRHFNATVCGFRGPLQIIRNQPLRRR
jgi:hypothetical protein